MTAQAAGTLSWGREDRAPGGPGGVSEPLARRSPASPGERGGSAGLSSCCPEATPPKRPPGSPGCRDTVSSRRPSTGGKVRTAAGASGDLGRVAGRPGVGETTAVGDLAAVPGGSIPSPSILVSALTAAP